MAGADSRSALGLWRGALVEIIRRKGPDLSTRQMAILLTVYLTEGPHSVRGLANGLAISKPATSRARRPEGKMLQVPITSLSTASMSKAAFISAWV